MSLTRTLAHNTISQIGGKVVSTLLGLFAVALMTRYLGVEQFGWYTTAITFLQFAGILTDFGVTTVTAQMLSEPEFDKKRLFKNLFTFRVISAVFFFTLVPIIGWFTPYPTPVKIAILFTSLSFISIALNQVFIGFLQTKLKMHLYAIGELVGRVVLLGGLLLLIFFGQGFLPIMGIITFSSIAFTFTLFLFVRKYTDIGFSFEIPVLKQIFHKMWPITLGIIFNVVYLKGDILLLTFFRSQEEVGLYGASYRVIDIITQIAMMMMGILLPLLAYEWSRKQRAKFEAHVQRTLQMMSMIGLPMIVGTFLLAVPLMELVAGPEFRESGRPLQILSLATFGLFLGAIFGHLAVAIDRQKQVLFIYLSAAVLTLLGYLIFIPKYGMIGAAWMSVFSELFVGFGLLIQIQYWIRVKIRFLPLVKIVFSTIVMGLFLILLPNLPVLLAVALGGVVYGLMLLITRAISRETIKEIIRIR